MRPIIYLAGICGCVSDSLGAIASFYIKYDNEPIIKRWFQIVSAGVTVLAFFLMVVTFVTFSLILAWMWPLVKSRRRRNVVAPASGVSIKKVFPAEATITLGNGGNGGIDKDDVSKRKISIWLVIFGRYNGSSEGNFDVDELDEVEIMILEAKAHFRQIVGTVILLTLVVMMYYWCQVTHLLMVHVLRQGLNQISICRYSLGSSLM
jgi:hypothetical protein